MALPPPGIYGDPQVNVTPPQTFYEPDPQRGPTDQQPPHEILREALMRMLHK